MIDYGCTTWMVYTSQTASIMPVIVSANLNANCIMIGEKCADFLRQAA